MNFTVYLSNSYARSSPKITVKDAHTPLRDLKIIFKIAIRSKRACPPFCQGPCGNKFHRSAIIIKKCRELVACKRRAVTRPLPPTLHATLTNIICIMRNP